MILILVRLKPASTNSPSPYLSTSFRRHPITFFDVTGSDSASQRLAKYSIAWDLLDGSVVSFYNSIGFQELL